jgi:hypothetical protein
MKQESIAVALRLSTKQDTKIKAFADVTIPLGDDGTISVLGFSILEMEGRPPKVMTPARKGKQSWFEIVELTGKIKSIVDSAVLAEYAKQTSSRQ